MKQASKPIVNAAVILREEFDDWAVLFNPDTADVMGTNPVGVVVWKLMDGRRTLGEIIDEVKARFAEVPDAVTDQIAAFIDELADKGFVGYELENAGP